MNEPRLQPPRTRPADQDLADQARPGHGIPSQDVDDRAQFALSPGEASREARSAITAGGLVGGAAIGAGIGIAVGGPAGVLVGGTLGALAGALGGSAAGEKPTAKAADTDLAVASNAVRLHIEDTGGRGRPVVLIHGWPLSSQAWHPQLAALREGGFRVVAYDRRGFGRSDRPESGYGYDTLADDLHQVLQQCDLQDATLVGFSMGGGEVARYITRHGESRLHSVVFAAAVQPYLLKTADNPDGPLTPEKAGEKSAAFERDRHAYLEQFTTAFFSADGVLQVTEAQRHETMALCEQAAQHAALACMASFATTDFRQDLKQLKVPTLVIHGGADAVVPFEGSGQRTHRAVLHSHLVKVDGAPHGLNVSHASAFNNALLDFLRS